MIPRRPLVFLLLACLASPATAQTIRGRVVLPDSLTPVANATVVVRNDSGAVVGRVASGEDGRYTMRLPRPGRYELQSIRIGFAPVRLALGDLARGEEQTLTVVMIEQPLQLAAVDVQADDRCRMSRGERERFVDLWVRARAALGPHIAAAGTAVQLRVLEVDGTEDGPARNYGKQLIWFPNARRPEVDSSLARERVLAAVLGTTSADTLAVGGYVRGDVASGLHFDLPNPEVLLSEDFLATHCFDLTGGPGGHSDWTGLKFRPLNVNGSFTDIEGTLWLDKTELLPRRVDYEYVNLPLIPCGDLTAGGRRVSRDRPPRPQPRESRGGPNCSNGGKITPREGIGGTLHFGFVAPARWFVRTWLTRAPAEEFWDRYRGYSARFEGGQEVRCSDRRPDCLRMYWAMPRLIVATGSVASVFVDRRELYRDPETVTAIDRVAALQAKRGAGHISGVALNSDGHPVPGVIVTTVDPVRATITDSLGRFALRTLPAQELMVHLSRSGYAQHTARVVLTKDATEHLTITLAPAVPEG